MTIKTYYPFRLVLDYDFLKWLIKECPEKSKIIMMLLRINVSSRDNKKCHNLIYHEDFNKLVSEGIIKDEGLIKGAIKPFHFPREIKDIIDKNKINDNKKRILMGILLSDEMPHKVAILTVAKNEKEYTNDSLFKKLKDVNIKPENEAIFLINSFFKKFCGEKEVSSLGGY